MNELKYKIKSAINIEKELKEKKRLDLGGSFTRGRISGLRTALKIIENKT